MGLRGLVAAAKNSYKNQAGGIPVSGSGAESKIAQMEKTETVTVQAAVSDAAPENKIIDAEETVAATAEEEACDERPYYKRLGGSSTSVNAIAREIQSAKRLSAGDKKEKIWQNCASLKQADGKCLCLKFIGYCKQDSCPRKLID